MTVITFDTLREVALVAYAAQVEEKERLEAEQAAQQQVERDAERAAQKTAFVAELTTLWRNVTGSDPVIDDGDLVRDSSEFYWRAAPGLEFDIRNGRHQNERNLHLAHVPYGTSSKITTMAGLGAALQALDESQQKAVEAQAEQARREAEEHERRRRQEEADARRAEIVARQPVAPDPLTVFCDGGGIHILPNGPNSLTLCPFRVPFYEDDRASAGTLLEFVFTRAAVQTLLGSLNLDTGAIQVEAKYFRFVVARPGRLTWFKLPQGYSTEWDEREEPAGIVLQHGWPTSSAPAWITGLSTALREWLAFCEKHAAWCNELAEIPIVD